MREPACISTPYEHLVWQKPRPQKLKVLNNKDSHTSIPLIGNGVKLAQSHPKDIINDKPEAGVRLHGQVD